MASWYEKNVLSSSVGEEKAISTPHMVAMVAGATIAVAAIGFGIYQVKQKRDLEKYGPKNVRQLGRSYAPSRLALRFSEPEIMSEYGGRALNTRQLARLGM